MPAPNSTAVVLIAVLAAAAAFAVTVRTWRKFSGGRSGAFAGRVGMLLATQVTMVLAFAAAVNANFAFYTNWNDLVGMAKGGGGTVLAANAGTGVARTEASITVASRGGATILGGPDTAKFGAIDFVQLHGRRTGLHEEAQIFLPPQYFQAAFATTKFPVVLVASGFPGSADEVSSKLRYPARLLDSMAKGKAQPMILVMMSPMVVSGRDTECTDVPGGPQTATFWAQDVPTAMAASYRTRTDAAGWALAGDSSGGYCAVKLAMMYSDRFSAAASISGYFDALQDHTTGTLYGGSQEYRDENDLMWRIRNLPSPPVAVLLTSSRQGEENYPAVQEFTGIAKAPMAVTTLVQESGGHNFATWDVEVQPVLEWLSTQLTAKSAASGAPGAAAVAPGATPSARG